MVFSACDTNGGYFLINSKKVRRYIVKSTTGASPVHSRLELSQVTTQSLLVPTYVL